MAKTLTAILVNDRKEISRLVAMIDQFGAAHHLSEDDVANINLIADEVASNVIKHGYEKGSDGVVHVRVSLEGPKVIIEVKDHAKPFNPLDAKKPDLDLPIEERPIGGLGVHIVRTLADSVNYRRHDGWNILTIEKTLGG